MCKGVCVVCVCVSESNGAVFGDTLAPPLFLPRLPHDILLSSTGNIEGRAWLCGTQVCGIYDIIYTRLLSMQEPSSHTTPFLSSFLNTSSSLCSRYCHNALASVTGSSWLATLSFPLFPLSSSLSPREIKILKKLRHRNIIELVEVFEDTEKQKLYPL